MGYRYERYENGAVVEVIDTRAVSECAARRVMQIKAEAEERILAIAPIYKQANLTARAAELALMFPGIKGEDLPEPYRSEYVAGQAIWSRIKSVRAASNEAEAQINAIVAAATDDDRAACDLIEQVLW